MTISATKIQELRRRGYSIADARKLLGEQARSSTPKKAHLDEWKELQARVKAEMGIGRRI